MEPRVVIVTRQTEYERMIATYGSVSNSSYLIASASMAADEAIAASSLPEPAEFASASIPSASKAKTMVRELLASQGPSPSGRSPGVSYAGGVRTVSTGRPTRNLRSRAENKDTQAKIRHDQYHEAVNTVVAGIPQDWRQARITRDLLDRFLFEPDDIVVVVGQDGLVPNVAKYITDQPVLGFNHAPDLFPGTLCQWTPVAHDVRQALRAAQARDQIEQRTMVEATTDNGQSLRCLNEIFVGHRSHQSARYTIWAHGAEENQSSSGVIIATATGAGGWAKSVYRTIPQWEDKERMPRLPKPGEYTEEWLIFMVREAWPSPGTGTSVAVENLLPRSEGRSDQLVLTSQMEEGGVVFGDGIEGDYMPFDFGRVVKVGIANQKLNLVVKG